jgi:mannose-6-phosphate isomerase-like protein (cupin superfamily)
VHAVAIITNMANQPYVGDVARMARENGDFRREVHTTDRSQVVLMALRPGEEIGEETHEGIDQILAFVEGDGEAVLAGRRRPIRAGDVVVVPGGTRHNFVAGRQGFKLYTVYAPPEHPAGTVHRTKAEADAAEAAHRRR